MGTKYIDDALRLLREVGHPEAAYTAAQELDGLRAALKPFADLAGVHARWADALGKPDDYVTLRSVDREDPAKDAPITVGDCRAAIKALEET